MFAAVLYVFLSIFVSLFLLVLIRRLFFYPTDIDILVETIIRKNERYSINEIYSKEVLEATLRVIKIASMAKHLDFTFETGTDILYEYNIICQASKDSNLAKYLEDIVEKYYNDYQLAMEEDCNMCIIMLVEAYNSLVKNVHKIIEQYY